MGEFKRIAAGVYEKLLDAAEKMAGGPLTAEEAGDLWQELDSMWSEEG